MLALGWPTGSCGASCFDGRRIWLNRRAIVDVRVDLVPVCVEDPDQGAATQYVDDRIGVFTGASPHVISLFTGHATAGVTRQLVNLTSPPSRHWSSSGAGSRYKPRPRRWAPIWSMSRITVR